ncbi:hypothetical protein EZS27_006565 [termite gut metagenome]|uniref:BACON domain-containing protein n=1 Tax=termite gut metagenome TaxID=433724 RepID=A0A5J4SL00_9ZZZZ
MTLPLFLGTACDSTSDDPEPYLRISEEDQSITLSADGIESKTIPVETNTSEWTVSVNADGSWCKVDKDGETIVISAEKNEELSERSATVTVSARNVEVKITVTQLGTSPLLQINNEDKALSPFGISGGTAEVNILTNIPLGELVFKLSDESVTWCEPKIENGKLTIYVEENIGEEARTVDIIITSDRIPAEQHPKITVIQFGTGYTLQIAQSSGTQNFDVTGGGNIVEIITNIPDTELSVTLSEPVDWLQTKIENGKLTITVDPNSGWDERTVDIAITSDKLPEAHPKIVVIQAGVIPVLEISSNTENFEVAGGNVTVDITTNISDTELSVTLSDPTVKWLQTKIENGKLTITVDPNPELNLRTVNITITSNRLPDVKPVIIVTQFGKNPTLEIGNIEKIFNGTNDSGVVDIITNIPDTELSVTLSEPVDWLQTKIENGKLTITVDPNPELKGRTVDITITSDRLPDAQPRITVIQSAGDPNLSIKTEDITKNFDTAGGSEIVNLITNIPDTELSVTLSESVGWLQTKIENGQLTITTDVTPGLIVRSVVITVTSELIPADQQPTITVTQGKIDSGTDFSITGYESQIFDVVFYNDNMTSKMALDETGKGKLAATNSNLMIKSIKADEGPEILIGRKESDGEIKLAVDADHKVQWRTKNDDGKTPLINTAAELLKGFNHTLPSGITGTIAYTFESDIDLMNELWTPVVLLPATSSVTGQNYKIHNLNIASPDAAIGKWGLFEEVKGSIRNLHIASGAVNVKGANGSTSTVLIGSFAGLVSGSAQIRGCSNSATMKGTSCGGICGSISGGSIIGCANYASVTYSATGGGTAGICYYQNGGAINACYNTGTITSNGSSNNYNGGITGRLTKGTITSCYNTGKIVGRGTATTTIGSINGSNSLTASAITSCFYSADSYTGAGDLNTSSQVFSSEEGGWPIDDDAYWSIGTGSSSFWKSLGTPGTTDYPKLNWEP